MMILKKLQTAVENHSNFSLYFQQMLNGHSGGMNHYDHLKNFTG